MLADYIRARIIALRKQKGITQAAIADKLGMDIRNYKRIESGEKKLIDANLIACFAEVLAEPLSSFIPAIS